MQTESLGITIIRTEGYAHPCLGCYISVNGRLCDVITPLTEENEANAVIIPTKGNLRLAVNTMGKPGTFLGSVSCSLDIAKTQGYYWLPLLDPTQNDKIDEIPKEISNPKILIAINPRTNDNTSEKLSKLEETNDTERCSKSKSEILFNVGDQSTIKIVDQDTDMDSDYNIEIEKISKNSENLFGSSEIERYKLLARRYFELKSELKSTFIKLEKSQEKQAELEKELNLKKENESILTAQIQEKDSSISALKSTISNLKICNLSLENDQKKLQDKLNKHQNSRALEIESLRSENENLKKKLNQFETRTDKLQNVIHNLSADMSFNDSKINDENVFKDDFKENKGKNTSKNKEKCSSLDHSVLSDIDISLNNIVKKHKLESSFIKKQDHVYSYENKSVYILLRNGSLFFKSDNGYKPIVDLFAKPGNPRSLSKGQSTPKIQLVTNSPSNKRHRRFGSSNIILEKTKGFDFDRTIETQRHQSSERCLLGHGNEKGSKTPRSVAPLTDRTNRFKNGKAMHKAPFK
ncbi:unnamed protein product [Blepharisma stoltei]|uniref:Uncharacterized protein n=1 Tax=Blepharisma stoltei TaxID=1481888 RepID=A0AAU9IJD4_9CILI|nr:unnamed protein product [Blepharisma stoltei]